MQLVNLPGSATAGTVEVKIRTILTENQVFDKHNLCCLYPSAGGIAMPGFASYSNEPFMALIFNWYIHTTH